MKLDLAGQSRGVHLAVPDGAGPWPAVVVIHDVFGMSADVRRIADWFAANGYLALAPDLLGGGVTCVIRAFRDLKRGSGTSVEVARAAIALLRTHEQSTGAVGVVGFCLGGGFALLLGADAEVDAIAPCYGPVPTDPEHLGALCPTVASYGDRDLPFRSHVARLRESLVTNGIAHDVVSYPNAGHSFMNRDMARGIEVLRPLARAQYVEEAAEDAWARILDFFSTHVGGDSDPA